MPVPSKGPNTIVLVHGFWVTPRSWEHWITRYEAQGYRVLAPAYPGLEVEVEALNRDPSPVERLTVRAIMTHLEVVVEGLETPPILMGHSAGGAFVQLLLANAGHTVPTERVTMHVWGYRGMGDRQLLKQLVHRLRRKIEVDPANPKHLLTMSGIGYLLQS